MLRVVDDPRPATLSYLAVISNRTLVAEDAEPAVQEEADKPDLELYGHLYGLICSAVAGAVCGLTMALML